LEKRRKEENTLEKRVTMLKEKKLSERRVEQRLDPFHSGRDINMASDQTVNID
jgi:hypothetical protein